MSDKVFIDDLEVYNTAQVIEGVKFISQQKLTGDAS